MGVRWGGIYEHLLKRFSPSQERFPEGDPRGGQFKPKGAAVNVGITSARPDNKDPRRIEAQMRKFASELRAAGIQGVKARLGRGGWSWRDTDGQLHIEDEPTWVLHYHGNGEAMARIAQMGRRAQQDAVLLIRQAKSGTPTASRRFIWKFPRVSDDLMNRVTRLAGEAGLGGWTWDHANRALYSVTVPAWSDPSEHDAKVMYFDKALKENGVNARLSTQWVETAVMEKEGERVYERFYKASTGRA